MGLRGCVLAAVAVVAVPAVAQEGPITFEFSFSNPGARSMGLGGAFAALADDSTAAYANPAGLIQLLDPEISVEGRLWSYDTPYVEGGRASGEPTGIGLDTVSGLSVVTSSERLTDLSFLSFVLPGKRWSLAIYRHQWANFRMARRVNGLFGDVDGEIDRSEDVLAETEFRVVNNGLAGALELTEHFSVGLGVTYFQAKLDSFSREFVVDEDVLYAANPFTSELLDTTYTNRGDDSGFAFQGGLLWRPSRRWSVGGYYRQGPEMTISVIEIVGPADGEIPSGTVEVDAASPLALPDVFGLGVAYRSDNDRWTVSAEWARVTYSSITAGLDGNIFDPGQIHLDDGDEYRLGVEYVVVAASPMIALRLGAWRDPAHSVGSGPAADLFERTIFSGGAEQTHLSVGLGVVFKRFQIDLGVDLADTVDQASLSVVYRF